MCSAIQPSSRAIDRGDPQREALLAQQRVAAVARAVGPDLARLGVVDDVLDLGVRRPRHVLLAVGSSGAPTECTHGTNSPSSPSTSSAAAPMRVMIRIVHRRRRRESVQLHADLRLVRAQRAHRERHDVHRAALHRRRVNRSSIVSRISSGSRQLFVGPASSSRSEQMNVRSSTRATSLGSDQRQVGVRALGVATAA